MSKVILISGASSGIGKETALSMLAKGYEVIGLSRSYPKEKQEYPYVLCDLGKPDDIDRAVEEIYALTDHIDVLVNCAGIGISGALEHNTYEEANKIMQVNVLGQFYITKKLIPLIRKAEHGKIINIGSVAGELTIPFQTFYSMSKAAMHRFTEGLRIELKPFGIGVSAVLPGDTKTGFTANRYQPQVVEDDLYKDRIKRSIQKMEQDEQNGMSPMSVVKVIDKLIKRKNMPILVTVGFSYKALVLLSRILPKRLVYWIITKMYG
ncbi:MAG: SDR family oxidoreductase [Bacilli bacterium]|nr:SDR family oxidoreductase [Bacilli bacterium]MBN2876343.1 SDR family oxidoreductase [Bacilli bacterium]